MGVKYRYHKRDKYTGEVRCRCGQWFYPKKPYQTICDDCLFEIDMKIEEGYRVRG